MPLSADVASAATTIDAANHYAYAANLGWDVAGTMAPLGAKVSVYNDMAALVQAVVAESRPGDHILVMSNGGFGGLHGRLLERLQRRSAVEARMHAVLRIEGAVENAGTVARRTSRQPGRPCSAAGASSQTGTKPSSCMGACRPESSRPPTWPIARVQGASSCRA